ncbi:MAG TPA: hypothetical protein VNC22_21540 [Sporichthya sp.]|jgi:hypothetical protein|nr:hypothetical protein [Sporichthya sp.]
MPRQTDQLPPDATTLAKKIQALERQVQELRAARRLSSATIGLIRTAPDGPRIEIDGADQTLSVYDTDGTLLAQLAPVATNGGGGGLWTRGYQFPENIASFLGQGRLTFQPVAGGIVDSEAFVEYITDGVGYVDLNISSGRLGAADKFAKLILESVTGSARASAYITGNGTDLCDLDVDGRFTAGNLAWGTVSVTPSAVNTPTSIPVTGLNVQGSTFLGFASANSTAPGTTTGSTGVTGVSTSGVGATGLTVWLNRQNVVATSVNWMVVGLP